MNIFNNFFFIAFPYLAIGVFTIGVIHRYRSTAFKYSSLSSQFLEGKQLFWGSVPFHFGILTILTGHLLAFLFPSTLLLWNSLPARLIILEVTGFIFAVSVVVGLVALMYRRLTQERLAVVTNKMDIFIELLILLQVLLGCWIAIGYRWGSSWFASDLSPYLWSIVKLDPQTEAVIAMPWVIKTHIIAAFLLLLLVPFSRLVHFMVAPLHYITRPYQQVIWTWNKNEVRDPKSPWTHTRPKNN